MTGQVLGLYCGYSFTEWLGSETGSQCAGRCHGPGVIPCQDRRLSSIRYYKLPVVIIMLILVKHIPDVIYNINAM